MNREILASNLVICRSGYSSLMDLAKLRKKAILVPTPGQTEQEYLAEKFFKERIFYFQKQQAFNLKLALEKSNNFTGFQQKLDSDKVLKQHIQDLLKT